jgi:formyl-CoA transferase
VTSSQLQTLMWLQAYNIAVVANLGRNFNPKTNVSPWFAIYQCHDDHWIAVSVQHVERQWPWLLQLFGFEDVLANPRYAARPADGAIGQSDDPAEQKRISQEVAEILARGFRMRPREEWLALLRAEGIGVGPVNTVPEVVADEQVAAEGLLLELDNGLVVMGAPFSVDGMPGQGAPAHGAHTFGVLLEAGYTDEDIALLYTEGVVAEGRDRRSDERGQT